MPQDKLNENLEQLTKATERLAKRSTLWYGFWHGIVVGIGSTVGVAIVLAVVIYFLNRLIIIPIIGPQLDQLLELLQNFSKTPR